MTLQEKALAAEEYQANITRICLESQTTEEEKKRLAAEYRIYNEKLLQIIEKERKETPIQYL